MKISQLIQLNLLMASTTLSAPSHISQPERHEISLLPREDPRCSRNLDDVQAIAESGAKLEFVATYTLGSSAISAAVCRILARRQVGPVMPDDCNDFATLVGGSVGLIYTVVQNSKQGTESAPSRRDGESSLVASLRQHFGAANVDVEGIEEVSSEIVGRIKRRGNLEDQTTSNLTVVNRVSVLGMQHENGMASDMLITTFDDDTGHIWTTPTPTSMNTSEGLSRRHDGAGFKINYRTINYAGNVLGDPSFGTLFRDGGNGIGNDWATRAGNDRIDEYVATTGIVDPKILTFGLRIIPETQGFGENYESVDICETLVPTHDEL